MVLVFSTLFADNGWPPEHGRDHDELVDILKVKVLHLISSNLPAFWLPWYSSCHSCPSVCLSVHIYAEKSLTASTLLNVLFNHISVFSLREICYARTVTFFVCIISTHSLVWICGLSSQLRLLMFILYANACVPQFEGTVDWSALARISSPPPRPRLCRRDSRARSSALPALNQCGCGSRVPQIARHGTMP